MVVSLQDPEVKSGAPLVFENAGQLFRPDSCVPLKEAASRDEVEVTGWARGNYPGAPIPDGILPGIRSLGVWDAQYGQSWGLGTHCNEGLEISFLSHGSLGFAAAGKEHALTPGDVTVTAPWLIHEVGLPDVEASRLIWIIIDVGVRRPNQSWDWPDWVLLNGQEKEKLAHILQNDDRTVWHNRALAPAFERLVTELGAEDLASVETDIKIQLNHILLGVARTIVTEDVKALAARDRSLETVRLFLARLHDHVDYAWRIEEMARQCGMSRGSFIQRCRELVNCPPHTYLSQLRMDKAITMLKSDDDATLTDIAMACGYSSSAHFSTSFKKETGVSPSQWRQGEVVR